MSKEFLITLTAVVIVFLFFAFILHFPPLPMSDAEKCKRLGNTPLYRDTARSGFVFDYCLIE